MSNGRVISFPIEFTVAQGNFKRIISELQQELTKIKPGTHIYDSLSEQLTRAQKLAEKTGTAIERGTTVSAGTRDIDAVLNAFQQLDNYIRNMQGTFGQLNFSDLNLGHSGIREEIQSLRALQTELENTAKLLGSKKNLTVGQALSGQNLTGDLQGAQNRGALEYLTELESKIESARQKIAQLQQEQAQLQSSTAGAAGSKAQGFLNYFEGIKTLTAGSTKMGLADAFTGPKLRAMVDAANGGGADAQKYQNILSMLGLSQETINAAMQEAGNNLTQAYQRLAQQLKQQATGLMGQGGSLTKGGLTDLVKTAEQEQSKLQEIDKQLNATNNQLNNLQTSHGQLGAVVNPTEVQNLASKVTELSTKVAQLESKILNAQRTPPTNNPPSSYPTKPPAEMALQGEKIKQQEALGNSLDMYARRWFSAYAIINKISQAVRQAWSDIKALDSAMTNIAVVTDMSVSDLWGKLGDYMSIAQQYGVTTQGVYEVSQLYYQQGLSTDEVMAATTETLKMARIAGMDYAEAADAMTVAIRSFKMEMTDAAHVTDVYSKVAAASASDSEELSIAMSKTASSAENVGSSFENTTAMLAVMIETTRESAQNLGSALKSIISRYGEMKVGSTVDADGEALDYNKVDTALKSVGISLKDAQGQFRDFDQVIFELSEKWDTLDSVTQRYIATIMAGNRQQSRFIALVDNWERLDELSGIANNAEDAGLLQYSKTLDSFDAKLNKLKNSFQSFYMQLFDSNFFKGILDALNDILEGFSEIGPTSLAMLPTVLNGFKVTFSLIKLGIQSAFSEAFAYAKTQSQIATGAMVATHAQGEAAKTNDSRAQGEIRQSLEEQNAQEIAAKKAVINKITETTSTQQTRTESELRQVIELQNAQETATNKIIIHKAGENAQTNATRTEEEIRQLIKLGNYQKTSTAKSGLFSSWKDGGWKTSRSYAALSMGASLAGSALSLWGAQQIGSGNRGLGAGLSLGGGALSGLGLGATFGTTGAVIGAVLGGLAQLPALLDAFDPATQLKDKLKKAEEVLEEANIKKAETNEAYTKLEDYIKKYKELEKTRFNSDEAYEEWVSLNSKMLETFPELTSTFKGTNDAIVDLESAERRLALARLEAADAAKEAAKAAVQASLAREKEKSNEEQELYDELAIIGVSSRQNAESSLWGEAAETNSTSAIIDESTYAALIPMMKKKVGDDIITDDTIGGRLMNPTYGVSGRRIAINTELSGLFTLINRSDRGASDIAQGLNWLYSLEGLSGEEVFKKIQELTLNKGALLKQYFGEGISIDEIVKEISKYDTYQEMSAALNTATREVGKSEYAKENQLKSSIGTFISSEFLGAEADEHYSGMAGVNEIFQEYLYKNFKAFEKNNAEDIAAEEMFNSWLTDYEDGYLAAFENLGSKFTTLFGTLKDSGLLKDYNAFMAKAGSYTKEEFSSKLIKDFGIVNNPEKDDEIYDIIFNQWFENYEKAQTDLNEAFKTMDLFTDDKTGELLSGVSGITKFELIPEEYVDEVITYGRQLNKYVDAGAMGTEEAINLFNSYMNIWDVIGKLDEEQKIIARQALAQADLSSPEGIANLTNTLKKEGIVLEGINLDNLLSYSLVNLTTSYQSLVTQVAKGVDSQTKQLQNAANGFSTFTEATEFADKIGVNLTDFTFEKGKWFLKNDDTISQKIKKSVEADLAKQRELLEATYTSQIGTLKDSGADFTYGEGKLPKTASDVIKTLKLGEDDKELINIINTYWDNYVNWINENNENRGKSLQDFLTINYSEALTGLDEQGRKALEWQEKEYKRSNAIKDRVLELSDEVDSEYITKAYNSIISKGLKGYTKEEIATLEFDLGIKNLGIEQLDGSFNLNTDALDSFPPRVRNALNSAFLKESKTALSSIENLGKNLFTAKETDYESAFTYLVEAGFQGKEIKKGINYSLMQAIAGDPKELKEYIGKELAHRKGVDYSDDFAAEYAEEIEQSSDTMVAAAKDAYIGKVKSFYDLAYKKIAGTATYTELEELDELSTALDIDLSSFNENLMSSLSAYAQQVADNAYISQENKEKALKQAAGLALDARAVSKMYGLSYELLTPEMVNSYKGLTSVNDTLVSSKNRMSRDQAASFFGTYTIGTGISLDTYMGMLNYNQADNTYSIKGDPKNGADLQLQALESYWRATGENENDPVRKALDAYNAARNKGESQEIAWGKLMGSLKTAGELRMEVINILSNPEIFQNLANAYASADYLGDEAKINKYASAVEDLAARQEQTFEETTKLYKELGIYIEPEKLYQTWLQGPIAVLNDLGKHLDSGLDDYSKSLIKEATERGVANLITSITSITDKATSGTATYDEMKFLSKQLGLDLTGMMTKTGAGYGLNQRGQLRVAAARAQLSGDYVGESQALIETFTGKGGIFGATTGKVLDAALDVIDRQIKALDQNAENYQKELDLLEAEQKVLEAAQQTYKQNAASDMSNFMGRDPYGGQSTDFDNYISSRKTAKEALGEAYTNKGVLKNYKQAAQMLDFIAYGQNWSPSELAEKQNILLDYVKEDGSIDMLAGLKEVFPNWNWEELDLKGALEKFASLMDHADDVLTKQQKERTQNTNLFTGRIDEIQQNSKTRLSTEEGAYVYITTKDGIAKNKVDLGKMSSVFGKVDTYKDGVKTQEDVVSADLLGRMAEKAYGSDWENVLTGDPAKMQNFISGINSAIENFIWDPTSKRSVQQQFQDHLLGETANLQIEERLKIIEGMLKDLTTSPETMKPLLDDLDLAISKVLELNMLLGTLGKMNITGVDFGDGGSNPVYTGTYRTKKGTTGDSIIETLKNKGIENAALSDDGNFVEFSQTVGSGETEKTVSYKLKIVEEDEFPEIPENPEIKYSANFDDVDDDLPNYTSVEGTINYSTPRESLQTELGSIEERLKELKSAQASLSKGGLSGSDFGLEIGKEIEQLEARKTAIEAILNGKAEVSTSFTLAEGDDWSGIEERLNVMKEAGDVVFQLTYGGTTYSSFDALYEKYPFLKEGGDGSGEDVTVDLWFNMDEGNTEDAEAAAKNFNEVLKMVEEYRVKNGDEESTPLQLNIALNGATTETATILQNLKTALTKFPPALGTYQSNITVTLNDEHPDPEAIAALKTALTGFPSSEGPYNFNITIPSITPGSVVTLGALKLALTGFPEGTLETTITVDTTGVTVDSQYLKGLAEAIAGFPGLGSEGSQKGVTIIVKEGTEGAAAALVDAINTELNKLEDENVNIKIIGGDQATIAAELQTFQSNLDAQPNLQKKCTVIFVDSEGNEIKEPSLTYGTTAGTTGAVTTPPVEEPAVEEPAVEEPVVEEPVVEEPVVEEPVVEEPVVEEKVVDPFLPSNISKWQNANLGYLNYFKWASTAYPESFKTDPDLNLPGIMELYARGFDFVPESTPLDVYNEEVKKYNEWAKIFGKDELPLKTTTPPLGNEGNGEGSTTAGNDSEDLLGKVGEIESYYDTYISKFLSSDGELTKTLFQEGGTIDLLGYLNDENNYDLYDPGLMSGISSIENLITALNQLGAFEGKNIFGENKEKLFATGQFKFPENFNSELMGNLVEFFKRSEGQKDSAYDTFINGLLNNISSELQNLSSKETLEASSDGSTINGLINNLKSLSTFIITNYKNRSTENTLPSDAEIPEPIEVPLDVNVEDATGKVNQFVTATEKANPTITIGTKILFNGFNLPGVQAAFTGNVNGIALADGNVGSLIAGAKLANKTLVGELGPELGVWDGQYHLLGQYGAEFADVPSDAIVFNHRQTEGILNGQWGVRGKALAGGTTDGFQGRAYDFWTTASGFKSFADFLNNYGGKKRNSKGKAYKKEDLEEWYNLLRKIAKLEAEIKLIEAERANMLDGNEILRSYREQQTLLEEQIAVQKLLVDYQREQLKLEADRIKQSEFWNNSLTFNEDGTLLSIFGNEIKDGEGRLAFLDQLNQLTGDQQIKVLKQLGYTYKDKDGKQLTGEKLVEQFFKEYTEIITSYNELDDSILEAEEKIETLTTSINNLNKEIEDNQKKLEKEIYDLLVESSERDIKLMKEQSELLQKANQKYVENLSEALEREQSLYQQNLNAEERARLQRQLSLLRRSGGSASEIADLEKQLSETLKEEYFTNQQNMIDEITKANEEQTRLMEQQITLQEEALEYQKENGIIWTKVYDIMSGSAGSILDFLQGNSNKFFKASALEQKSMLLEWAKMVGIYDEDRAGKVFTVDAKKQWENNEVLPNLTEEQQGHFDKLTDKDKKVAQEHYNTAYTSARLEGMSDEEARKAARDSMVERLRVDENGIARFDPHTGGSGSGSGGTSGGKYATISYNVVPEEAKNAGCKISGPSRVAIGKEGSLTVTTVKGYRLQYINSSDSSVATANKLGGSIKAKKEGKTTVVAHFVKVIVGELEPQKDSTEGGYSLDQTTLTETLNNKGGYKISSNGKILYTSKEDYKTKDEAIAAANAYLASLDKKEHPNAKYTLYGFSQGGLVDYTGLAMVHGSQSKPEAFLNAAQTEQISEALRVNSGKNSLLENLQNTVGSLRALVHNIGAIDNSTSQDVTIAPGAIVINVDQLADSYDVEELSADIMNRMVSIASKATNRGVNRR